MTNADHPTPSGRILALDVGRRRIGLAVSDELGITAQGLDTLHRRRIREDLQILTQIINRWRVTQLLVGRPLHMSGDESPQSEYTREFADRLSAHTALPVVYWDERLTSAEAERFLRQSGAVIERSKGTVDRLAAVLLLESYLEFSRYQKSAEGEGPQIG